MIAVVDYGVGNLFSIKSSFGAIGEDAVLTGDLDVIRGADRILLPGVGAFADAAKKLSETGLGAVVIEQAKKGVPLMGICLGMQLLFDVGLEYGVHKGLGLIDGEIRPISEVIPCDLKIPHIGWNALKIENSGSPIMKYVKDGDCVYFVHSYHAVTDRCNLVATTEYGADVTASVQKCNVFGCQFHPEKSGDVGLKILKAFCEVQP